MTKSTNSGGTPELNFHGIGAQVDDALAMQLISIRLPKSLIEDFKLLAELNGLGYQPLMRRILTRWAECEKKNLMNEVIAERRRTAAEERSRAEEDGQSDEPEAA